MKTYIWIIIVVLIVAVGAFLWNMSLPQPLVMPSPSMSASPAAMESTSLKVPAGGVTFPTPKRAPVPAKNEGTVVFAVKDKAQGLDSFKYILVQLSGMSVHSPTGGWKELPNTPPLLDLLKLSHTENEAVFISELNLPTGTYDQIRFDVGSVVLMTQDGKYHEAKVPSKQIKLNVHLVIEHGNVSTVTIDMMADKSIHMTGNGLYIFLPVLNLETRSKVTQAQVLPTGYVTFISGKSDTVLNVGMDENGMLKKDFVFDNSVEFDIVENVIHVLPKDKADELNAKITAQQAIDIAVKSGEVSSVLSVKVIHRANKVVWQVAGFKGEIMRSVFVDVITGLVVGTE